MADHGYEDEDFEEEEIWAAVHHHLHSQDVSAPEADARKKRPKDLASSSSSPPLRIPHERSCRGGGGGGGGGRRSRQSAPVNIPDWPKIYHHDSGEEEDDDKLPPHEWLARKMARSHISSSVCEGAGRTLKGRDLSRVRNAVLTRTGFLE